MKEIAKIENGQRFSSVVDWAFCEKSNTLIASLSCGKMKLWGLKLEGLVYITDRIMPKM